MTSGVPFHYAGNVKAQLSQWLYPWCKGNSVISFFFPPLCLSLSLFLRDHPPPSLPRFPALDGGDIYRRTANRVPFVSEKFARHVLLSRRILGEEEGRRQMMERSWERFMGRNRVLRKVRERRVDIFILSLDIEGIVVSSFKIRYFAKNFLFGNCVRDICCKYSLKEEKRGFHFISNEMKWKFALIEEKRWKIRNFNSIINRNRYLKLIKKVDEE